MRNNTTPRTQRPRHRQIIFSMDILKAAFTEFILTFIFVFAGTGSRIAVRNLNLTGDDATFGLIATAIAHAFALSTVVCIGVKTNGGNPYTLCGHVNPAVTFGAFMGGNIHIFRCLVYWVAQLLASIGACSLLMFVTGGQSLPIFGLSNGVGVENALVLEMVMTLGLVFTMCATVFDPKAKGYNSKNNMINCQDVQKLIKKPPLNKIAPLAIGLIFGANILVGGPFDGASMNPALSFGPAVVTWSWGNHWVYWVGPLIGGGLAGFTYDFVFINN